MSYARSSKIVGSSDVSDKYEKSIRELLEEATEKQKELRERESL